MATRETLANNLAFLQMDLTDPDLRVQAVAQSRELRHRVRLLLADATEAGELVPVDAPALARQVVTTYNGALVTWAVDGRGSLKAWMRRSLDATLDPYRPTAAWQALGR